MKNFKGVQTRIIRPDDRVNDNSVTTAKKVFSEIWHYRGNISIVYREEFRRASRGRSWVYFGIIFYRWCL